MTNKKATRLQRKGAKEILRLGQKALAYRKDLLSQDEAEELECSNLALIKVLKTKPILFEELDHSAKRVDQALQKGIAAYKEGKLLDAERFFRAVLQAQPNHPDANHNLGVLAVAIGKPLEAIPLFILALEASPKIEQFWLSYIDALIKVERPD